MDAPEQQEQLRIGFLSLASSEAHSTPGIVRVPDLTNVLSAFQRAVYATAAYELQLSGIRRLTDEQRRDYMLAVVATRQGSFWVDLFPLVATYQAVQQLLPFSQGVKDSLKANLIWATITHTVKGIKHLFGGEKHDEKLDAVLLDSCVKLVNSAIKGKQAIEIYHRDSSGEELRVQTSLEGNVRVLARAAVERGKLREFRGCVIKDLLTSQPVINVEIPEYPEKKIIRCEYERGQGTAFMQALKIGDVITIFGTPVWPEYHDLADPPNSIEIAYLVSPSGQLLGGQLALEAALLQRIGKGA